MRPMNIMNLAKPYILQGAFVGALTLGIRQLGKMAEEPVHPLVESYPMLMSELNVATSLSQLIRLTHMKEDRAHTVLKMVDAYLSYNVQRPPDAQGQMSRLLRKINDHVDGICKHDILSLEEEAFRGVITCQEEVVPTLLSQLDDILYNHILANSPTM